MSRIEDLEKRLVADPNSKIFVQLAEEYRKAGLQEDAIATCRDGLEKHPNYFSARVALGRALLESNALEEAREEFEKVLQQVPDNLLALKFLGATYQGLGHLQEALSKYQLASTLSPEDTDLVDRIGQVEAAIAAPAAPAQSASRPPEGDAGTPSIGEQSMSPTIPPARPASSSLIERQASEIGGSDFLSEDVRSMQEEIEDQPVTSIFKRQAREIMDLGSIPQPVKKSDEPPGAAPGAPDDVAAPVSPVIPVSVEPTPLTELTEPPSAPPGAPQGSESATPPTMVPQSAPATGESPPASSKPEFGIPSDDEPMQSEPMPLESIEPLESVEPIPLDPSLLEQVNEPVAPVQPVQPVQPVRSVGRVGFGATEGPTPAEPVEPIEPIEEDKPGLATETLAELYASQGHLDRALGVYRQLVATQPDNVDLRGRLEELEMLVKASEEPTPPERGGGGAARGRADSNVPALEEAVRALEGWLVAIGRS